MYIHIIFISIINVGENNSSSGRGPDELDDGPWFTLCALAAEVKTNLDKSNMLSFFNVEWR